MSRLEVTTLFKPSGPLNIGVTNKKLCNLKCKALRTALLNLVAVGEPYSARQDERS
ncbi:hypothetical protein OH492_27320 [Vibrio chagasii]|nr:hypothetical protein [Vibrio chagasii]